MKSETVEHFNPGLVQTYIREIDYNEKGQRKKIVYGNGVTTRFEYDKETFQLKHLETKRSNNDLLQDIWYTFDPVGNISHIEDRSIPTVIAKSEIVQPVSTYTYDALYQLIEATGRENDEPTGLTQTDNWNDAAFMRSVDATRLRNFKQLYKYDEVGNITEMKHVISPARGTGWTRSYEYEASNNRLKNTRVGEGAASSVYDYGYHANHGFINRIPHLQVMGWNFKDELIRSATQKVNSGTPETTYYQYDAGGQRVRKITESQATAKAVAAKKDERIYIAGFEVYREHSGSHPNLERTSLSLLDQGHRFVTVETRNEVNDDTDKRLIRYQLHNHLGSSAMELEGGTDAKVISYEEYHPYGTTAYQARSSTIRAAAKRYRYTGMERDEETGLGYHSARYYLPWLGRWLSSDPIGIGDGVNLYCFVRNNPVGLKDPSGTQASVGRSGDIPEDVRRRISQPGVMSGGEAPIPGMTPTREPTSWLHNNTNTENVQPATPWLSFFIPTAGLNLRDQSTSIQDPLRRSLVQMNQSIGQQSIQFNQALGAWSAAGLTTGVLLLNLVGYGSIAALPASVPASTVSTGSADLTLVQIQNMLLRCSSQLQRTIPTAAGTGTVGAALRYGDRVESNARGLSVRLADQAPRWQPVQMTFFRFTEVGRSLTSNLSRQTQSVRQSVQIFIRKPGMVEEVADRHARGITNESPFVSLIRNPVLAARESTERWLRTIATGLPGAPGAARAPQIAAFRIPLSHIVFPTAQHALEETEALFYGDNLVQYLINWMQNPF